jgi:glycosyltransferase involved in cell wall biosynthesis
VLSFAYQALQFLTFLGDARRPIYREASRLLAGQKFDVILATGEPFVLFRYASKLSKRHGVPWVADYRDLWRLNHIRAHGGALDRMLLAWEGRFERRFLRNAAFAVTVSEELSIALAEYLKKPVHVLPNGAELTLYDGVEPRYERFTLVYTGILYDLPYVGIFASGFRKFMAAHPDAEIDALFVGISQRRNRAVDEILRLAEEFPRTVKVLDRVPLREAARHQARGTVLLSFIAGSQSRGLFGAKTYSYAATRNPILVVPNDGGRETSFFPGRDIQRFALDADEVNEALSGWYERFQRGEPLRTSITDDEVFSLSCERQVGRLAEMLKRRIA